MISFTCKCGKNIKVEDKYAGKKGKCPKCKEVVVIPQPDNAGVVDDFINDLCKEPPQQSNLSPIKPTKPMSSPSTQTHIPREKYDYPEKLPGMPVIGWCLFVVTTVSIIGGILYVFVFRDTWEMDNYSQITQMFSNVNQLHTDGEWDNFINDCNELNVMIGDREFKRDELRSDYLAIQEKYETVKKEIRAEKERIAEEKAEAEKRRRIAEVENKKQWEYIAREEARKRESKRRTILNTRKQQINSKRRFDNAISGAVRRGLNRALRSPSTARIHPISSCRQISYNDLTLVAQQSMGILGRNISENTFYNVTVHVDAENLYGAKIRKLYCILIAVDDDYSSIMLDCF